MHGHSSFLLRRTTYGAEGAHVRIWVARVLRCGSPTREVFMCALIEFLDFSTAYYLLGFLAEIPLFYLQIGYVDSFV